jgi:hypothetical protein
VYDEVGRNICTADEMSVIALVGCMAGGLAGISGRLQA